MVNNVSLTRKLPMFLPRFNEARGVWEYVLLVSGSFCGNLKFSKMMLFVRCLCGLKVRVNGSPSLFFFCDFLMLTVDLFVVEHSIRWLIIDIVGHLILLIALGQKTCFQILEILQRMWIHNHCSKCHSNSNYRKYVNIVRLIKLFLNRREITQK